LRNNDYFYSFLPYHKFVWLFCRLLFGCLSKFVIYHLNWSIHLLCICWISTKLIICISYLFYYLQTFHWSICQNNLIRYWCFASYLPWICKSISFLNFLSEFDFKSKIMVWLTVYHSMEYFISYWNFSEDIKFSIPHFV
jgi:hypothetical protein